MKRIIAVGLLMIGLILFSVPAKATDDLESRIRMLEETLKKQQNTMEEQQKIIDDLKAQVRTVKSAEETKKGESVTVSPETAKPAAAQGRDYRLDDRSRGIYVESASPVTPYNLTKQTSTPSLLNPAISLTLDTFYYNSNLSNAELDSRNSPGFLKSPLFHDDQGFNLRSAELTFFAPVDPYFNLYATIPFSEGEGAELEEAYFVTTSLPAGFQVKGGKFKSGFGRFNAFHPHAWDFVDAPLPYKLFFGGEGEGLTEKGAQLTYLPPLPIYTILGAEILQGDNDTLFGPDAQSGPHAYTGFAKASLDIADNHTILFGASVTGGKTKTDTVANDTEFRGDSVLYGGEFTYKWRPSKYNSFTLQSEYLLLDQDGDLDDLVNLTSNSLERLQDGLYIQALYQWERWRIGARYGLMELFTSDYILGGENITFSGRPYVWTGALEYNPSEFSRIRLQYNYDRSDRSLAEANQEIFLQLILAVGAHGAHPF
jgi:hypothetical protein